MTVLKHQVKRPFGRAGILLTTALAMLGFASALWAQSNVQYIYDALGRLTAGWPGDSVNS